MGVYGCGAARIAVMVSSAAEPGGCASNRVHPTDDLAEKPVTFTLVDFHAEATSEKLGMAPLSRARRLL